MLPVWIYFIAALVSLTWAYGVGYFSGRNTAAQRYRELMAEREQRDDDTLWVTFRDPDNQPGYGWWSGHVFVSARGRTLMNREQIKRTMAHIYELYLRGELWSYRNRGQQINREAYLALRDRLLDLRLLAEGPNRSVQPTDAGLVAFRQAAEQVRSGAVRASACVPSPLFSTLPRWGGGGRVKVEG